MADRKSAEQRQAEHAVRRAYDSAEATMRRLVEDSPGTLRIITSAHACPGGPLPRTPEEVEACERYQEDVPLTDPRHFVCEEVVRVEGAPAPYDGTHYRAAYSGNGAVTIADPVTLLDLLQKPEAAELAHARRVMAERASGPDQE